MPAEIWSGEMWPLWCVVGVIAFSAGFLHSAIGFGFGIVAISLLPFVIDAKSAHILVSISSVPMLAMATWTYREGVEKRSLRLAVFGAALFLPLGLMLFESVSLDLLVRGTGLGIFVMAILSLRGQDTSNQFSGTGRVSCFVAGAASGFLAGAVSIAGPPVAAFALKQGWSQARYKAFVTQCLFVISIYKAGLLVFRSHVTGPLLVQILISAALAVVGVRLGAMASRGIPATRFRHLVAIALLVSSCVMIIRGHAETPVEESTSGTNVVFEAEMK